MGKREERLRQFLFVLLIVIIFISVLGTWTVLDSIDNLKQKSVSEKKPPVSGASVSFEILGVEELEEQEEVGEG